MKTLIMSLLLMASQIAFAGNSYICKKGSIEREITVVYEKEGAKAPCEVKYKKDKDSEAKVNWSAQAEEGYCEKKAKEFSEKLSGMGFSCEEK